MSFQRTSLELHSHSMRQVLPLHFIAGETEAQKWPKTFTMSPKLDLRLTVGSLTSSPGAPAHACFLICNLNKQEVCVPLTVQPPCGCFLGRGMLHRSINDREHWPAPCHPL